jgi:AcrR family transcriptional regulator
MGKLEQNKAENRSRIVDAAYRVFAEKGVENARISDIVRESGLARGTFYNYFETVEDIWATIVGEIHQASAELAHQARSNAADPFSFMADAYRIVFSVFELHPDAMKLLAKNQRATREALMSGPRLDSVLDLLADDMRKSGFFDHLTEEEIAIAGFSMVGSALELLIQFHERGIALQAEHHARLMAKLFYQGLRAPIPAIPEAGS